LYTEIKTIFMIDSRLNSRFNHAPLSRPLYIPPFLICLVRKG